MWKVLNKDLFLILKDFIIDKEIKLLIITHTVQTLDCLNFPNKRAILKLLDMYQYKS